MMETLEIPNKSTFKLNEVCGLTGVKPYVLRFWESEFTEIDPIISSSGQKMYEAKDIQAIATLKNLLFEEKMNIEMAKAELPKRLSHGSLVEEAEDIQDLDNLPDLPKNSEMQSEFKATSISRMSLSDDDMDKLMMAKNLLRSIL